jgi:hypothetical protein
MKKAPIKGKKYEIRYMDGPDYAHYKGVETFTGKRIPPCDGDVALFEFTVSSEKFPHQKTAEFPLDSIFPL